MSTITIQDIQRDPLAFLHRIEAGESFLITRADDQPVAELKAVHGTTGQLRPFGRCAGQFHVPDDFDQPLPIDVLKEFEGR